MHTKVSWSVAYMFVGILLCFPLFFLTPFGLLLGFLRVFFQKNIENLFGTEIGFGSWEPSPGEITPNYGLPELIVGLIICAVAGYLIGRKKDRKLLSVPIISQ